LDRRDALRSENEELTEEVTRLFEEMHQLKRQLEDAKEGM
jgi:hypothetical protein